MKKIDELYKSESCLNKAGSDEMVFVLLARDPAAPEAIRDWSRHRINKGLDPQNAEKLREAEECAKIMEQTQATAKEKALEEKHQFEAIRKNVAAALDRLLAKDIKATSARGLRIKDNCHGESWQRWKSKLRALAHNLIAHPLAGMCWFLGLTKWGDYIHERA